MVCINFCAWFTQFMQLFFVDSTYPHPFLWTLLFLTPPPRRWRTLDISPCRWQFFVIHSQELHFKPGLITPLKSPLILMLKPPKYKAPPLGVLPKYKARGALYLGVYMTRWRIPKGWPGGRHLVQWFQEAFLRSGPPALWPRCRRCARLARETPPRTPPLRPWRSSHTGPLEQSTCIKKPIKKRKTSTSRGPNPKSKKEKKVIPKKAIFSHFH